MKPIFITCPYLKVYNDVGFNHNKDVPGRYKETGISNCECKLYMHEKGKCPNRGRCVIAREKDTWKQVSKKSWK